MSYELINWKNNDDITAEKLNKMDQAIFQSLEQEYNIDYSNIMCVKDLKEPLDDWNNLDVGIYLITDNNRNFFYADTTKNYPSNRRNGLVIVHTANNVNGKKLGKIEFYPTWYNGNPVDPKYIKIAFNNSFSNWITEKAPNWNISFTEKTNETPVSTDNSKKIADTAFVKSQIATMDVDDFESSTSFWSKEPSGMIAQFIELTADTEEISISLPISFSQKCLFVGIEIDNEDKDISKNVSFNVIEKGLDSIKLFKIGEGTPNITVMVKGI